jgi:hypothetical protein
MRCLKNSMELKREGQARRHGRSNWQERCHVSPGHQLFHWACILESTSLACHAEPFCRNGPDGRDLEHNVAKDCCSAYTYMCYSARPAAVVTARLPCMRQGILEAMGSNNRNRHGINPCQHSNPVSSFAASLCSIRISSAEADARGVRCMNNNNSDNLFVLKRAQLLSALLIALVLAKLYFLPRRCENARCRVALMP